MLRTWLLVLGLAAGCSAEVAAGLDETQSQEALAALAAAGIAAEREPSGEGEERTYRLVASADDSGRAAAVLRSQGLPRTPDRGFAELYGSASMIPTATEEKARFLHALSGQIAGHLERLPGVVDASVIVTAPEADPLAPPEVKPPRPTASVLLRLRHGAEAPADEDVRRLVAGAVENMTAADVAVVVTAAAAPPADQPLFASIGPIRVARSSKGPLIGILGGACAIIMAMGVWIVIRR